MQERINSSEGREEEENRIHKHERPINLASKQESNTFASIFYDQIVWAIEVKVSVLSFQPHKTLKSISDKSNDYSVKVNFHLSTATHMFF